MFAPISTYFSPQGDGSILGRFTEHTTGNFFEFSTNNTGQYEAWPHLVWVSEPSELDHGYRYARVLKTRVYIVVDEDEDGLVTERWIIRQHREYQNND